VSGDLEVLLNLIPGENVLEIDPSWGWHSVRSGHRRFLVVSSGLTGDDDVTVTAGLGFGISLGLEHVAGSRAHLDLFAVQIFWAVDSSCYLLVLSQVDDSSGCGSHISGSGPLTCPADGTFRLDAVAWGIGGHSQSVGGVIAGVGEAFHLDVERGRGDTLVVCFQIARIIKVFNTVDRSGGSGAKIAVA